VPEMEENLKREFIKIKQKITAVVTATLYSPSNRIEYKKSKYISHLCNSTMLPLHSPYLAAPSP